MSKYADALEQLPATKRIPMDPKQVRFGRLVSQYQRVFQSAAYYRCIAVVPSRRSLPDRNLSIAVLHHTLPCCLLLAGRRWRAQHKLLPHAFAVAV